MVVEIPGASFGAGVGGFVEAGGEVVDVWVCELEVVGCWVGRKGWGGSAGIASV